MFIRPNFRLDVAKLHRATAICAVLCSLCLLLLLGCLSELQVYEPAATQQAALHRICCADMRSVMDKIDKSFRRAHRLPVRQMRNRNFAAMEEYARQLAKHAGEIVKSADLSGVSPEDAAIFKQLAERLGSHADALSSASAKKKRHEVRKWFAKVTATCNSCHAAFRGSGGYESEGGA